MERFSKFRGRVALRSEYKGRPLKPGVERLNGIECEFLVAWQIEQDESYPGEYALEPTDPAVKDVFFNGGDGVVWLASGDVVRLDNS